MAQLDRLPAALNAGLIALVLIFVATERAEAVRPVVPPAGDCRTMVAAAGAGNIWFGRFSGRYEDTFRDGFYYPVAASGCFRSEYACRRWTNQLLSITGQSGLMSCRPYNARR